eukprot:1340718-Prymnesium_polylepis.1
MLLERQSGHRRRAAVVAAAVRIGQRRVRRHGHTDRHAVRHAVGALVEWAAVGALATVAAVGDAA